MNFVYPAIISKTDNGYHARFPDLEMCEADGPTLDVCLDEARYAMEDWIRAEFEEEEPVMPFISDPEDIRLEEGEIVRNILVIYRFYDGWDE
jgi:predicted RNase H-like HicB family nuclease